MYRYTHISITEQDHLALSNMFCAWKWVGLGQVHILLSGSFDLLPFGDHFQLTQLKPQSRCRHKNFGCTRHIAHPIFANDKRFCRMRCL